jgi:hypothetical protein
MFLQVYLAFVLLLWHRDDTNLLLVKEGLQRYMVRTSFLFCDMNLSYFDTNLS